MVIIGDLDELSVNMIEQRGDSVLEEKKSQVRLMRERLSLTS